MNACKEALNNGTDITIAVEAVMQMIELHLDSNISNFDDTY